MTQKHTRRMNRAAKCLLWGHIGAQCIEQYYRGALFQRVGYILRGQIKDRVKYDPRVLQG